jgi:hypothetical protein
VKFFKLVFTFLTIAICTIGCGRSSVNNDGNATPKTAVFGTVLDAYGNPVEGATVTITSIPVTVITDSEGDFSAIVEIGEHEIKIEKDSAIIWSSYFTTIENQVYIFAKINTTYNTRALTSNYKAY